MKIRGDYMLDTIGGEKIAVPLGAGENNQTGLVRLNEVGAFLWEKLMEGTTEEDLVQDVTKQYEVGTEKAAGDVKKFLEKLKSQGPKASALRLQKKRSTEKMYLKRRIQEDIWKALPFTGRFQKQSWITMLFCFTVRQ